MPPEVPTVMPLRRHRLAFLTDAGWATIRSRDWDAQAQACIDHWARHRLPLVVTRQAQPDGSAQAPVALGLPAPTQWGRRRLALQAPYSALAWFDEFPQAADASSLLPRGPRATWRALVRTLAACQAPMRVYGSYGWQLLTGLPYVRDGSDIDVWIPVHDIGHADGVTHHLETFASRRPRLDGELVFADGTAVAWREWSAWRAGRARQLLVKRLHGAALADATFVHSTAPALEIAA
jgi:phosphoribosyl-dephospho-CoA transferase